MGDTITGKQLDIIQILRYGCLKKDAKGRLYFSVPSSERRNGRMLVSVKELRVLERMGLLSKEQIENTL